MTLASPAVVSGGMAHAVPEAGVPVRLSINRAENPTVVVFVRIQGLVWIQILPVTVGVIVNPTPVDMQLLEVVVRSPLGALALAFAPGKHRLLEDVQ